MEWNHSSSIWSCMRKHTLCHIDTSVAKHHRTYSHWKSWDIVLKFIESLAKAGDFDNINLIFLNSFTKVFRIEAYYFHHFLGLFSLVWRCSSSHVYVVSHILIVIKKRWLIAYLLVFAQLSLPIRFWWCVQIVSHAKEVKECTLYFVNVAI